MGKKAEYRARFTSLKSESRAGVYYPETGILWTEVREEKARVALADASATLDADPDNAEALALKARAEDQLKLITLAKEQDEMPLVITPVSDRRVRELEARVDAGELAEHDRDLQLVIDCVHAPRFDSEDRLVWENGQPVKGDRLYGPEDREYLTGPEHSIGGELFRLKIAVSQYIREITTEGMKRAGKLVSAF